MFFWFVVLIINVVVETIVKDDKPKFSVVVLDNSPRADSHKVSNGFWLVVAQIFGYVTEQGVFVFVRAFDFLEIFLGTFVGVPWRSSGIFRVFPSDVLAV